MFRSIPVTVVPFRYAVTFADSSTAIPFESRAELAAWIAERAYVPTGANAAYATPANRGALAADRRAYAAAVLDVAEARGYGYAFAWDVPACVEAWQSPQTQGEAEDLAAWMAATLPVGARVATLDALTGTLDPATVTESTPDAVTIERDGAGTLTGATADIFRILTDAPSTDDTYADGNDWDDVPASLAVTAVPRIALDADGVSVRYLHRAEPCTHAETTDRNGGAWCVACGAWQGWNVPPVTAAEADRIRDAVTAVAAALDGMTLPADLTLTDANGREYVSVPRLAAVPTPAELDRIRAAVRNVADALDAQGPLTAWEADLMAAAPATPLVEPDADAVAAELAVQRRYAAAVELDAADAEPRGPRGTGPRSPLASRAAELAASPFPLGRL